MINFDERLNHEASCELFFHEVIFFLSLLSFNEKSNQSHNDFSINNLETLNFNPEHFHTIIFLRKRTVKKQGFDCIVISITYLEHLHNQITRI